MTERLPTADQPRAFRERAVYQTPVGIEDNIPGREAGLSCQQPIQCRPGGNATE